MKISARNVFTGEVTALTDGAVNAEVEMTMAGGDKLVSIITSSSVKSMRLTLGKVVVAIVKAPWVTVLVGHCDLRFSTRNQLKGTVSTIMSGPFYTEVGVSLPGGEVIYAMVTNDSAKVLELKEGMEAIALIKASHVILGTSA